VLAIAAAVLLLTTELVAASVNGVNDDIDSTSSYQTIKQQSTTLSTTPVNHHRHAGLMASFRFAFVRFRFQLNFLFFRVSLHYFSVLILVVVNRSVTFFLNGNVHFSFR